MRENERGTRWQKKTSDRPTDAGPSGEATAVVGGRAGNDTTQGGGEQEDDERRGGEEKREEEMAGAEVDCA
jgi:lysophospholipase L1-like esterase